MTDAIPTTNYDPDERIPEPLAPDEPGEADEPQDEPEQESGGEA